MGPSIQVGNAQLNLPDGWYQWPLETFEQFQNYPGQLPPKVCWQLKVCEQTPPKTPSKFDFDTLASWRSYQSGPSSPLYIQQMGHHGPERRPLSLMALDAQNSTASLYYQEDLGWSYPLDEILFLYLFSFSQSLLVHSCLLEHKGAGYLFCGVSGAGKTTLAQLLSQADFKGQVLCDERNVISFHEGQFWVSSTPWWGSGYFCTAQTVPLKKVILLDSQHQGLSLQKCDQMDKMSEFFRCLFLPEFSRAAMTATIEQTTKILEKFEVYKLNYDKSSVHIDSFLESEVFSQ